MHGMVFGELKRFVDVNLGGDSWLTLLEQAGLAKQVYIPVKEYPDKELFQLVGTASEITGIAVPDLLKTFGTFIIPDLLLMFRRQIEPDWNLLDLFAQIETTIHKVVRLRNPGAKPPQLRCERKSPTEVTIFYSSSRKICFLGIGLIQGIADAFEASIDINETTCMHNGHDCCTISIVLKAPLEEAKSFSSLKIKVEPQQNATSSIIKPVGTKDKPPIVIVGAGPVGVHAAREFLRNAPDTSLVLYGAEPWKPYNRVKLSDLLAGEIEWDDLANDLVIPEDSDAFFRINTSIVQIDRENKYVIDSYGNEQPYSKLVLALGSRAKRADANAKLSLYGVHTYRDVDDAQNLMTHITQSTHAVVAGGGVLGIEVAFALKAQNPETEVTIIHRNVRLINRQLDDAAAEYLLKQVKAADIHVIFNAGIEEFIGTSEIEMIRLANGEVIPCDTLISCTGIDANTFLALDAGIKTDKGIQVNDYLQTSDDSIYAIGECAEHNKQTYGLIGPGIEQATIAVKNILDGNNEEYKGTALSMRVKIKHLPVFSLGTTIANNKNIERLVYEDSNEIKFREIFLEKGQIIGAVALGDCPEIAQIQESMDSGMRVKPWHRFYFSRTGSLSPDAGSSDPSEWSETTMICTCGAVTKGDICTAMAEGCDNVLKIAERTGAAIGCGTCKPLLAMLSGSKVEPLADQLKGTVFFLMLLTIIFSCGFFLPSIPALTSTEDKSFFTELLFDNGWRQVTGYSVLSLMVLSFVLTLNKRLNWFQFASFYFWRVVHIALLATSIAVLLVHTNFSLGENFNFNFSVMYFISMFSGVLLAIIILLEGGFFGALLKGTKVYLSRFHILLIWILTGLTMGHIASVYYF